MATPSQYNSNIPQPTDKLSISQADLLLNFQAIEAWIDLNHIQTSDTTRPGFHNFIQMPNIRTGAPYNITGTGATQTALFTQPSVINAGTPPALWFAKQNTLLAAAIEISEYQTGTFANAGEMIQEYLVFKLINGLIVKAGRVLQDIVNLSFPQTITFKVDASLPVFNNVYYRSVSYTNINGSNVENDALVIQINMSDTTKFTVTATNGTLSAGNGFYYLIIGD